MEAKEIVETIFKDNNIHWEVKTFDKFVDPKCKTANSIYDKLLRLYLINGNEKSYSILDSNIDDLLRMTIIVDYKDVVKTINKLKLSFSDLSGYLQIENAGYRGVHLNLKIEGVPCEIQLAPKIVVMAVDYLHTLYEKWRSFDAKIKLECIDIKNNEQLQNKIQEEKEDFALRNKVYGEIYKIAEFDKYKDEIRSAIEDLNKTKKKSSSLSNPRLKELLNQNLLENGKLDREKIKEISMILPRYLEPVQVKFIKLVQDSLLIKDVL